MARPSHASRRRPGTVRGTSPRRGLPDHVRPGLRVLFVGINPGLRSAAVGHHYAGRSNRFWRLLHDSGLVPERLPAERDAELLRWEMGLTNLVARPSAGVGELRQRDFALGRRKLLARIRALRPEIVALVGLTVCQHLLPAAGSRPAVGLRAESLHGARVFVLPNTSGRNAHYSYAAMLRAFKDLAKLVGS